MASAAVHYGVAEVLSYLVEQAAHLSAQAGGLDLDNYEASAESLFNVFEIGFLGELANDIAKRAYEAAVGQDPGVTVHNPGIIAECFLTNFNPTLFQDIANLIPDFSKNLGLLATQWPGTTGLNPFFNLIDWLSPENQKIALDAMDRSTAGAFKARTGGSEL